MSATLPAPLDHGDATADQGAFKFTYAADPGGWGARILNAPRRTGNGPRVMTHATPEVHSAGTWRARVRCTVGETPDRGDVFTHRAPGLVAGEVRGILAGWVAAGVHVPAPFRGALPIVARQSRQGRPLTLDGHSIARKAAGKVNGAKRRSAKVAAAEVATATDLASLAALAAGVRGARVRRAPMTAAERSILSVTGRAAADARVSG